MNVRLAFNIAEGSFNRYMVECESQTFNQLFILIIVLIDTWWNVNKPPFG